MDFHSKTEVDMKTREPETQVLSNTDSQQLSALGYTEQLSRNRSKLTLLAQSLTISNIPYGIGGPLAVIASGGGQLSLFVGWIVVSFLSECIALSLAELASRYPTSAGPYFWTYQLCPPRYRKFLSYVTGWTWIIGNWTVSLSAHFGLANYVCACASLYNPELSIKQWQITLLFFAFVIFTSLVSSFGNRVLPHLDAFGAFGIGACIIISCICLSVKAGAGRHSLHDTLVFYDTSYSGLGSFSFFIGLLPSAYTYSAIGMISSMAEECNYSAVKLPQAIALMVPISFVAGFFFIIPICHTLPPLDEIVLSPFGQGLPFVYGRVMASASAGFALSFIVLVVLFLSCLSITTACSRATWAFARDQAIPGSSLFDKINTYTQTPVNATIFAGVIQMLLGLIGLGSTSAFNSFVSVGVISLAASYGIPIAISLYNRRKEVANAEWNCGRLVGPVVNVIAVAWIAFELVLFSMPTYVPVTAITMTYASVVFAGFIVLSAIWYVVYARKVYNGPPESDGISNVSI